MTSQDISNLTTFFRVICQTDAQYTPRKCHACEHAAENGGCNHPLNPIEHKENWKSK
jgi:hypothetical protein